MNVQIQYQDLTGNWRTINQYSNTTFLVINMALESVVKQYKTRARAIDSTTGSIVDLRG